MSDPKDAPAAAWYPDPQTPGQVRCWDGTTWTEHVSTPSSKPATQTHEEHVVQRAAVATDATVDAVPTAPAAPAIAEFVEHSASVTYIGRHAAGATPAPRHPSTAPRIRPRQRVELTGEVPVASHSGAQSSVAERLLSHA